jgi:hypothetical protein
MAFRLIKSNEISKNHKLVFFTSQNQISRQLVSVYGKVLGTFREF